LNDLPPPPDGIAPPPARSPERPLGPDRAPDTDTLLSMVQDARARIACLIGFGRADDLPNVPRRH
jgi:hypothetical protein